MKKRSFFRFIKNKYTIIGLIIIVILVVYYVTHRSSAISFESAVVTTGNVIEKVSITGTISPLKKADLAFKKGGVIYRIPVAVGDHVKKGDLIVSLDDASDIAVLASAQAMLDDLSRSLSPEEFSVQKTALDNAKENALNAVSDGYTKAQSALVNYVDNFFSNPQSVNPNITIRTDSESMRNKINYERVTATDALNTWSSKMASVKVDTVGSFIGSTDTYLRTIKLFMDDLSQIVGRLNPSNSGTSQSVIDLYTTAMNGGLSTLNSAISVVTTAEASLSLAQSNYDLKLAGNSSQSVAAQKAKVAQAQANVNDDRLLAPIDGIITRIDPNVGEFVGAGQTGFAIQDDGGYKIEAHVPEADVAKVAIGNKANVTLDAYGQYVIFPASVISIDPAETVLEGVPTYKVTLRFDTPDIRIRSGMTANTDILTHEVNSVLIVPTRAILDDNGNKSIRIINSNGLTFVTVPIVAGLKGSDGTSQIISGVNVGDKVVTYVK